ncbi:hypothetical protein C2G38_2120459 [Gigaspora rosea]|uniref:Uncharacterized protein n=1 Tax=Gigaspora rosea TaxID=44941 RepID=A0A397U640_9GLOM|nr:hypothetical protein C2G38_2120459 [Gigaspora rosea]
MSSPIDLRKSITTNLAKETREVIENLCNELNLTQPTPSTYDDLVEVLNAVKNLKNSPIDLRKFGIYNMAKETQEVIQDIRKELNATQGTPSAYDDLVQVLNAVKSLKEECKKYKDQIEIIKKVAEL